MSLDDYVPIVGADVVDHLRQLAAPLRGMQLLHVNSTRSGGGVAEILHKLVPLTDELGIRTRWEVMEGEEEFFACTKGMHNGMQGMPARLTESHLAAYERTNASNAERLREPLQEADVVIVHDPQPAALLEHFGARKGKWIWRCHIDASHPHRPVWKYLQPLVAQYDASIFSLAGFARQLPHPQYLIPPSIDPLSPKNCDLEESFVDQVCESHAIDRGRPLLVQVSRFDRFKDPVGVIQAYRLAKASLPALQLVLAGGGASDDPEGDAVLSEVRSAATGDDDIKVLALPGDENRRINALQRAATLVLQKSLREGFGLTVTEALWKSRPVIGGDVGGIRLQVVNHHTGFLVSTPEGAAMRVRYLLNQPEKIAELGAKGRELVRDNFLVTRHLREYLTLMLSLLQGNKGRIELSRA